ncbi:MAG: hypothetical protein F7C81_00555 [Desulfurococcales archaeon]|nr:hypothetical protein [Desulfurococcales archaeon]
MGLVNVLLGLDLIAGRATAIGADFLLSGPLNLWFRGLTPNPKPFFVLVTSFKSADRLVDALSIGATSLAWPESWGNIRGRRVRLNLRGYVIAILVDPEIETNNGITRFVASDMARRAGHVVIGDYIIRLAPLDFEYVLRNAVGGFMDDEAQEGLEK